MSEHYRLPKNARDFIFNSQLSYSEICKVIEQEHGYKISKGTISYHKRDSPFRSPFYNASGRDHDLSKIDEWEKGYLVGFFAGDGSTYMCRRSNTRFICFYLNAKTERLLAQRLICILSKANLRPRLIHQHTKNTLRLQVGSKALYKMMNRYLSWKLGAKTQTVKLQKLGLSDGFMRGFVAGMADSDGGIVGLRRWYRFASISSELIKKLKEILESFDIEANIRIYRSKQKNRHPLYYVDIPLMAAKMFSLKLNPYVFKSEISVGP